MPKSPGGELIPYLDPEQLLRAYTLGIFPMGETRTSPDVFWVEPKQRGIIDLGHFHLPRSLAKLIRQQRFVVTADRAFIDVVRACAEAVENRPDSWINPLIIEAYTALHRRGNAHSIEIWQAGELVGGLYGVKIGAAFFGESMFSRRRDASKLGLAYLVARLKVGGFKLLDTQFITSHLARFGASEIPRAAYCHQLAGAIATSADFFAIDAPSVGGLRPLTTVSGPVSGNDIVQLLTQTS